MNEQDFHILWDKRFGDNPVQINGSYFTKDMAWNSYKCNYLKEAILSKITIYDYSNRFTDFE